MRLRSEVWVHAYLRACQAQLINVAVVRHGDNDAGVIYIKINRLDGTATLFGPAPSPISETPYEQSWMVHLDGDGMSEQKVDNFLQRQIQFDSDLWILEVEDRNGRHELDEWLK